MADTGTPVNAAVGGVTSPPIADVNAWVADMTFPPQRPLLNLAQAVPAYPPAAALTDHVGRVAKEPASALYAPILGLARLRERLAVHLTDCYRAPVAAGEVAITAGCNQAFCVALTALAGHGDDVVLPVPWYFNHQMWLAMQGIAVRPLPFDEAASGLPDLEAAARSVGPRTRAIVLVSPNNPTGSEYPPELLDAFMDLAVSRGAVLVVDETYKDFRSRTGPPHGLFAHPRWRDHLVSLHSFSKSYAMAGYRVGALACGPALMRQVEKIMDCVAICAPRLSQEAALFALEQLEGWRDGKTAEMAGRVTALRDAFRSNSLAWRLVSAGAYFAWVRHPFAGEASAGVARRLARAHGVLSVPGATFGPGLEGYLRLAFANVDGEVMPELAARLVGAQAP